MQTESKIEHNRPDIVVIEKKSKTCYIIDVACPFDTRIEKKEMKERCLLRSEVRDIQSI